MEQSPSLASKAGADGHDVGTAGAGSQELSRLVPKEGGGHAVSNLEEHKGSEQSRSSADGQASMAAKSNSASECAYGAQPSKACGGDAVHQVNAQSHQEHADVKVDRGDPSTSAPVAGRNNCDAGKEGQPGRDEQHTPSAEETDERKKEISQSQVISPQPTPEADPGKDTEKHVNLSNLHAVSSSQVPTEETSVSEPHDIGEDKAAYNGSTGEHTVDSSPQGSGNTTVDDIESKTASEPLPTDPSDDRLLISEPALSNKGGNSHEKHSQSNSLEMAQRGGGPDTTQHVGRQGDPRRSQQYGPGNRPQSIRPAPQHNQGQRSDGHQITTENEPRRAHFNEFPEHPDNSKRSMGLKAGGVIPYKGM